MILKPRLFRKPRKGHWATKGLVGLWLLNEGSGNTKVLDLSGNMNHGTISGALWSAGNHGYSLLFDGGDDYIDCGNNSTLNPDSQMTIIASVILNNLNDQYIFAKQDVGDPWASQYYLEFENAANVHFYTSQVGVNITGGTGLAIDTLYQVACVLDGSNGYAYLNGILDGGPDAQAGAMSDCGDNLFLGNRNDGGHTEAIEGKLNYVMMWNRGLSASEIVLLYKKPFCMFERESIDLWVGATSVGAPAGVAPTSVLYGSLVGCLGGPV